MNKLKAFVLMFLSMIIQNSVLNNIDIFHANINMVIPLIIVLAQILKNDTAAYVGLFLGLVEDILFTNFIGIRALSYYLIGYVISYRRFNISKDMKTGMMLTFVLSVINVVIVNLIYLILQSNQVSIALVTTCIVQGLLNIPIYILLYKIVNKIMYVPTYRI